MAASIGADTVVLSGGEPTIRPDLLDAAGWLKKHNLGLGLVTNGRMLVYDDFRKRLLENGLEYVYLSVAGTDPDTHDWHTRTKSFSQFIKVAPLVAREVDDFTINFVITAKNLRTLQKIIPLLERLGLADVRLKLSFLEPEGNALNRYDELVPSLLQAGKKLIETISVAEKSLPSLKILVDGFPLCAPGVSNAMDEGLREDGFFAMAEAFEDSFYPVDDRNKAHPDKCISCSLAKKCKGVFKTYLERFGDKELIPIQTPVPNSFDLVKQSLPLSFDEKNCLVMTGEYPPPDAVRGLFIKDTNGNLVQHYADSRDFSDGTVSETLHQRNQVYVFDDPSPVPTDFEKQLIRFEKSHTCIRCPKRTQCGGVFLRSKENGFKKLSEKFKGILSNLTGRVLDIGCGHAPYIEFLEPNIENGNLHYTGLEPDDIEHVSGKGKLFVKSSFESFVPPSELFDYIISLRSLNHLDHPVHAIYRMRDMLKAGGEIILAEDVVFSLVRPSENLEKARYRHDLPFEHKFNLDLEEVCAIAQNNGFSLKAKYSCTQTKTPIWIGIFEKTDRGFYQEPWEP